VTHFKGEEKRRRTEGEKIFEQRLVEFEIGRELHKDGAEVVALVQHAGYFQEAFQSVLAIAQPLDVCDSLVRFQGKLKTFGDDLRPLQQRVLRRHVIEGVIDLNRFKPSGVETQHLLIRELLRVKTPLPLLIGVAGSANTKLALSRNQIPPFNLNLITAHYLGKGAGSIASIKASFS